MSVDVKCVPIAAILVSGTPAASMSKEGERTKYRSLGNDHNSGREGSVKTSETRGVGTTSLQGGRDRNHAVAHHPTTSKHEAASRPISALVMTGVAVRGKMEKARQMSPQLNEIVAFFVKIIEPAQCKDR
jgi:hypothetical protein